ncbi:MAG: response regulator [candidate division FCPU426 bacterium]
MRILLADDDPITLRLLENSLKNSGYEIVLAHNGPEAWQLLTTSPQPDVALLDWMMPELDGLEICRRQRARKDSNFVYIILVTSNDRPEDITIGLDAGANDYITKPFNKDELKSRISVGVRVANYENALKITNERLTQYSQDLEQLAQERAQQLVRADRMIVLGTMAAGIAHEINNPLTIVQGNLGLLKHFWRQFGGKIFQQLAGLPEPGGGYQPQAQDVAEMIENAEKAVRRLRAIVDGMRSLSHGQGGKIEALDPKQCLADAIQICLPKTKHLCQVQVEAQDIPFQVKANPVQVTQILVNLIANAADALAGTPDPSITARIFASKNQLHLSVQDNGPGIPSEALDKIWSPLFTTKPMGQGTGLGLAICHKIAEDHGGALQVESLPGRGATFTLSLPNETDYDRFLAERQLSGSGHSASEVPSVEKL